MGGRDAMLADALSYADVAFGGAVCITVLSLLGNAVRGTGSLVMIGYLRSSRSIVHLKFDRLAPQLSLFADILKVGVPGQINTAITNFSVVLLTGIAGQFGPEAAIGYALGARLEYIIQPVAFGFGTTLVPMVGTNWGAQQYGRARRIAWTGVATIATLCGAMGLIVAVLPFLWLGLFSADAEVARSSRTILITPLATTTVISSCTAMATSA